MKRVSHVKAVAVVLVFFVMLSRMPGCGKDGVGFHAGTYFGEAAGKNGPVKIAVTVDETRILSVSVMEHGETQEVVKGAIANIPAQIVAQQSIAVDAVTGATQTSLAILSATKEALEKAGGDLSLLNSAGSGSRENILLEEKRADVIVIGAGGAGLSAAIEAASKGASVLVLEKFNHVGGNTAISTGLYNAVDVVRQGVQEIEDSNEAFYQETIKNGDNKGNPTLVKILVEQAYDGLLWLESLGMQFSDSVRTGVGNSVPRGHCPAANSHPVEGAGNAYIRVLHDASRRLGIEILLETRATDLLMDEQGEVYGVKAFHQGATVIAYANNGVILSTGGFGGNTELRMQYDPRLTADVRCSNLYGITGDGIVMAEAAGADLIDMAYIQFFPLADIYDGSLANSFPGAESHGILVNMQAERFFAEDERRDKISDHILSTPEGMIYSVIDSDYLSENEQDLRYVEGLVDMGRAVKADNLTELADKMKVSTSVLTATIQQYNSGVRSGHDKFGRKTLFNQLDVPPYYATRLAPTIHYTSGGVRIDDKAQVLRPNGTQLKGLYAAGEVTGGIHGPNRLGGNSLTDIVVFGRIAGRNAANYSR